MVSPPATPHGIPIITPRRSTPMPGLTWGVPSQRSGVACGGIVAVARPVQAGVVRQAL